MLNITEITEAISEAASLKILTQSYSEVAANKLKHIRNGIERNRNFLAEIATIYATIKLVAAQRQYTQLASQSKMLTKVTKLVFKSGRPFRQSKDKLLPKKSKTTTINILLTSNYRFYGNLERILIEFFLANRRSTGTDSMVIGKTGIEYLRVLGFTAFKQIVLKKDLPDANEIKTLITQVGTFDRVLVFHSKFQSVLAQTPFIKDVKEAQFEVSIPRKKIDYIFEPEIDKMLAFFDTQISSMLLTQAFLESELARTAARLISMTNAQTNADKFLKEKKLMLTRSKRALYNVRLLDNIASSLKVWRAYGKH